ncbi:uncharacterized protein [Drosophila takahashii]|uniref:uncharacterized protein n=1 Tax=Drosophila takahashii TaxID=29030 RepID=UPI001CF91CB5|nr:uncharacterized protein LOC108063531 [Drosophila takahashii]
MRRKLVILALFEVLFTYNVRLNEAVVFKFTNVACDSYNTSWYVFHNCRLKAVGRDKVLLNFSGTILNPAYDIRVHTLIFKKANGYRPWLVNKKIEVCRYLRHPNDPVATIVYGLFKDFSNLNHTCPYVGQTIVKDFYLRPELVRLPIPTGDYLLSLRWYFDKKLQFDTNVSYTFVEDFLKQK